MPVRMGPGFKLVGDDLPKFATGGLLALVGHLTSKQ